MLVVIALLTAAERAARLLCKRLRASLAAEFFAGPSKSLGKGIAGCSSLQTALPPPSSLLYAGLDAYRLRVKGLLGDGDVESAAFEGLRVQDAVRVGLAMVEVSLGLAGMGWDSLCTRQSGRIGGCVGDKWSISKSPAKWALIRIAYHAGFSRGINGASRG